MGTEHESLALLCYTALHEETEIPVGVGYASCYRFAFQQKNAGMNI